jgi:thioredoxin-like negative regulator of GroEL
MENENNSSEEREYIKYKEKRMKEIKENDDACSIKTFTNEFEVIEKTKRDTMIVHFYDDDYETCRIMDRNLKYAKSFFKDIEFIRINANVCPIITKKLGIHVLPQLGFFSSGFLIDRIIGFEGLGKRNDRDPEALVEYIKNCDLMK